MMQKLIIEGGNVLSGELEVSGSKNASLPILFASILATKPVIISRLPHLSDISTTLRLLTQMGAHFTLESDGSIYLEAQQLNNLEADYQLVKTMRASILVLGPTLAKYGEARVSLPGGCAIGARPVNLHIENLKKLGAEITIKDGYIVAKAKQLIGTTINFDKVSVTATENIMMAATLAKGTTTISNAAQEPEVSELARFLNKMGAKITGYGSSTIIIEGVKELSTCEYKVCADRIEAGTYLIAAAITKGDILLKNVLPNSMEATIEKLKETGAKIKTEGFNIHLDTQGKRPKAVNIKTAVFPGLATDMQAQFLALNTIADGYSTIVENIFENRFMHVPELQRMGADLEFEGNTVICRGKEKLNATELMATDLRASASLVLASLAAEGTSIINRVYHLDRGYETIEAKLNLLGANIQRAND
ncbi:UDP-N-acetylglucosamine 1-carboxyvinyltransferase [hydrothermal vent metagenome]|uniref:UDP-N-acetylglucosamine 1-carboxyvinyltransferase n=1 Tax=hydrothermal vent metagenome TaxID=652676 RepID=A0A1W1C7J0_9ZZZZ